MASPPWKSNVGGPSDEELNRIVQAHEEERRKDEERRRVEVKRLVADAEVYDWRLGERRSREYTFWGKGRYRGRRLTNITPRHTASAAVNEGSIKALRTTLPEGHDDALKGLPNRPSIAWLRQIDKNASIDQGRTETAEKRKRAVIQDALRVDIKGRRTGAAPSSDDMPGAILPVPTGLANPTAISNAAAEKEQALFDPDRPKAD